MSRGDAVIVQGALQSGAWNGRADVLLRVETPSRLGTWSYEVTDTKLARETKGTRFFRYLCIRTRLSVDALFIDEAAQMALANVLAVAHAAQSVVLLGDPRQLEQPIQGSHPHGVGVSALDHVLGPHATIPADRGLFLSETWRLHPLICAFSSELFYEGRLKSRPGLERQESVLSPD